MALQLEELVSLAGRRRHRTVCQVPFSEKENTSLPRSLELSELKETDRECRNGDWC